MAPLTLRSIAPLLLLQIAAVTAGEKECEKECFQGVHGMARETICLLLNHPSDINQVKLATCVSMRGVDADVVFVGAEARVGLYPPLSCVFGRLGEVPQINAAILFDVIEMRDL